MYGPLLDGITVWMTQSFVSWLMSALGQEESQKDAIHQIYHVLQTSQLPASLCSGYSLYPPWLEMFT